MAPIRTRLAPSPSSADKSLHLGNLRTALYAYLVAKKSGGQFLLRIENTDIERNVLGCEEGMLSDLRWLGIGPDEGYGTTNQPHGPYTQLEKTARYKEMANWLIGKGLAYKCVCKSEDLNRERDEWIKRDPKNPWRYDGRCRNLKTDPDKDFVVRFKAPTEGETIHEDLVFGRIVYPHKENYDWVLMRANGMGLYNFCCVIDDLDHRIDLVVRGRDHMGPNTLQQLLLHKAFENKLPQFAHLPMVLNMKGQKLSKRDGAVNVKQLREAGYSPSAILSFVAKLGWGRGDQELFSLPELIEHFDLSNCNRNDGRFDYTKFQAINFAFLKSDQFTTDSDYASQLLPFLQSHGLNPSIDHLKSLIPLVRPRSKTFIEAANELDPILRPNITMDKDAETKFLTPDNKNKLHDYSKFLQSINDWTETSLRAATQEWLTKSNLTLKDIGQPSRVALVGRTTSPELFQTIAAIGKQTAIERLSR